MTTSKPTIYHEKQVKELCALHALNNLFQVIMTLSELLPNNVRNGREGEHHLALSGRYRLDVSFSGVLNCKSGLYV